MKPDFTRGEWQALYRKWDGIRQAMHHMALEPGTVPLVMSRGVVLDTRQAQASFRSQVARAVCRFYRIKLAYALANPRSRGVLCYILHHRVGMTVAQAAAFIHVSPRQAARLIRKASTAYPLDIHTILTRLGWGNGDTDKPRQEYDRKGISRRGHSGGD